MHGLQTGLWATGTGTETGTGTGCATGYGLSTGCGLSMILGCSIICGFGITLTLCWMIGCSCGTWNGLTIILGVCGIGTGLST